MKAQGSGNIQPKLLQYFSATVASGRLAHAYLLSGSKGAGKYDTALALAQMVNCLSPQGFHSGCLCASCAKIASGNHPDIFILVRDEERSQILIEQIRSMRERFNLRVWEGRMRVGIIVDAENMNAAAANALLKTLEEPFARTLLILTTSAPDRIMATIRSRCQEVPVPARSKSELAQSLINEYHIPSAQAGLIAGFARGSIGLAAGMSDGFMARRDAVIDQFILGHPPYDFIKTRTEDKESARELLDVILTFFRDVALIQRGAEPGQMIHFDRWPAAQQVAAALTVNDVERILAGVVSAIKGTRENLNIRLSLMLLKEMM